MNLTALKDKNKALQDQVRQLQQQLEIVHGELYKIEHHIKLKVIK